MKSEKLLLYEPILFDAQCEMQQTLSFHLKKEEITVQR